MDWYTLAGLAIAILGAGEAAQRLENAKTEAAENQSSPWDEAAARQRRLTAKEMVASTSTT
ncbi:hypothetical protein ABZ543_34490 [Streptomyces roseifaciens]